VVRAKDHAMLKGDRRLDRIEGEPINEVKSHDGPLGQSDKAELVDHLALVGEQGAEIKIAGGDPRTVKRVKWTFLSPEGGARNADWMVSQLKDSGHLSFEVFNAAGQPKIFTQADVVGPNAGSLHAYLGIPKKP
jgi:hypothetical protein